MLIGVPKEIKPDEYRVALTPAGVEMFVRAGHDLVIEKGAGLGSGFTDDFYEDAGATMLDLDLNTTVAWISQAALLAPCFQHWLSIFFYFLPT